MNANKHELKKGKTVWRDASGRVTRPGDLRAVRAHSADGRVWDVSGDTPVLLMSDKANQAA